MGRSIHLPVSDYLIPDIASNVLATRAHQDVAGSSMILLKDLMYTYSVCATVKTGSLTSVNIERIIGLQKEDSEEHYCISWKTRVK